MKNTYICTVQQFLNKTKTSFEAKFLRYGVHFDEDKTCRDIYQITLKRGERSYVFSFGQSINASGRFWKYGKPERGCSWGTFSKIKQVWRKPYKLGEPGAWSKNPSFEEPDPYSVLCCLPKYDVGTFEDFCGEFGYDTDSRTAEKIYKAVCTEYATLCTLFNEKEMEELRRIQ